MDRLDQLMDHQLLKTDSDSRSLESNRIVLFVQYSAQPHNLNFIHLNCLFHLRSPISPLWNVGTVLLYSSAGLLCS
jgi:hypothetical protein